MAEKKCDTCRSVLKEQEWHFFHQNEEGVMEAEGVPINGEDILWYRKVYEAIEITVWDDDNWAEYAATAYGETFEDGDAWMILPKPQKH